MTETIVLYALKCRDGYVKIEGEGFRIVDMQKTSVFRDLDSLLPVRDGLPDSLGAYAVELTISERSLAAQG
jgi:hypothetical protein